ncbi:MAG: aminoacyl-tRNA hydrolase, partial [Gaiellaceae bacterium]
MRLWPRRQGSSLDLLVVGLGNPGREYAGNRHNVGQMVVDELARRHGGSWRSKFSGRLAEIRLDGHSLALLKPETFMNESGRSVGAAMRFFKLDPDAVLVVHDEGDLE